MDDLRWILAAIGGVIVVAIYLSGRFEREAWRRDRESHPRIPVPARKAAQEKPSKKKPVKEKPVKENNPLHQEQRKEQRSERREPHIGLREDSQEKSGLDAEVQEERSLHLEVEPELEPDEVKGIVEDSFKYSNEKLGSDETSARKIEPSGGTVENDQTLSVSSVGISSEEDVERVLERSNSESLKSKPLGKVDPAPKARDELESDIKSRIKPLPEEEIVEVEIPEDVSEFDEKYEIDEKQEPEQELKFRPDVDEPVQQELMLEIEPLVLVLTVMAKGEAFFDGALIRKVLEASGLNVDEKGIFDFHMTGKKDPIFSVVSVIEPGIFDINSISEYETPGLSFFCQLPGPLPNADIFRIMHMKALNVAEKLGGQLCDDRRNLLTEQSHAHYNDRVKEFDREMVLARKKRE